ncbi:uncharacterized protein [Lepisosteus oculatus]|uniref:uncharacterized protein isoform X2 n=1 Tax=Lepisosteus oculatus TaxID=7918 RepID=UPI0035F52211
MDRTGVSRSQDESSGDKEVSSSEEHDPEAERVGQTVSDEPVPEWKEDVAERLEEKQPSDPDSGYNTLQHPASSHPRVQDVTWQPEAERAGQRSGSTDTSQSPLVTTGLGEAERTGSPVAGSGGGRFLATDDQQAVHTEGSAGAHKAQAASVSGQLLAGDEISRERFVPDQRRMEETTEASERRE